MAHYSGIKYIWGPLRALLRRLPERTSLLVLSVVTGLLCGLAAVLMKLAIHGIQGGLSSLFPGMSWPFLILPGVGMLLSGLIVRYLVKDNIGHGVTKVLQAVSKNESKIKRHNVWSSLVTSALTIGFGGSVGAEAPIVYTGAAIGSNLGRYCGISYRGMTLLLGCGAAGALAGIFNAPLEVLMSVGSDITPTRSACLYWLEVFRMKNERERLSRGTSSRGSTRQVWVLP